MGVQTLVLEWTLVRKEPKTDVLTASCSKASQSTDIIRGDFNDLHIIPDSLFLARPMGERAIGSQATSLVIVVIARDVVTLVIIVRGMASCSDGKPSDPRRPVRKEVVRCSEAVCLVTVEVIVAIIVTDVVVARVVALSPTVIWSFDLFGYGVGFIVQLQRGVDFAQAIQNLLVIWIYRQHEQEV